MIAFAPFAVDEPILIQKRPVPVGKMQMGPQGCTECNMLVLAFIAGIFLMALFDALK